MKKPAAKKATHAKAVAKHPKPAHDAKPKASSETVKLQGEVTRLSDELTTLKHSLECKTRTDPKKSTKHTTKRTLSPGLAVACCSAEVLAASLRLAGHRVSDADVLDLYWRTATDPDEGASILATLRAAREYGLVQRRVSPCVGDAAGVHADHSAYGEGWSGGCA